MMRANIVYFLVVLFIITHAVRLVLNIDEMMYYIRKHAQKYDDVEEKMEDGCKDIVIWRKYVKPFNGLPIIINSSSNFFIYVYFYTDFRKALRDSPIVKNLLRTFNIGTDSTLNENEVSIVGNDVELTNMNESSV